MHKLSAGKEENIQKLAKLPFDDLYCTIFALHQPDRLSIIS